MTKAITKIGNSQGLMFDATLMDVARIKPKKAAVTAKRLIRKNAELFPRLS